MRQPSAIVNNSQNKSKKQKVFQKGYKIFVIQVMKHPEITQFVKYSPTPPGTALGACCRASRGLVQGNTTSRLQDVPGFFLQWRAALTGAPTSFAPLRIGIALLEQQPENTAYSSKNILSINNLSVQAHQKRVSVLFHCGFFLLPLLL